MKCAASFNPHNYPIITHLSDKETDLQGLGESKMEGCVESYHDLTSWFQPSNILS